MTTRTATKIDTTGLAEILVDDTNAELKKVKTKRKTQRITYCGGDNPARKFAICNARSFSSSLPMICCDR